MRVRLAKSHRLTLKFIVIVLVALFNRDCIGWVCLHIGDFRLIFNLDKIVKLWIQSFGDSVEGQTLVGLVKFHQFDH
jgi:hypothetical protein